MKSVFLIRIQMSQGLIGKTYLFHVFDWFDCTVYSKFQNVFPELKMNIIKYMYDIYVLK